MLKFAVTDFSVGYRVLFCDEKILKYFVKYQKNYMNFCSVVV